MNKSSKACFHAADRSVEGSLQYFIMRACLFSLRSCTDEPTWPSARSPSTRSVRKSSTSPCRSSRRASASWLPVATGPFPHRPFLVRRKQNPAGSICQFKPVTTFIILEFDVQYVSAIFFAAFSQDGLLSRVLSLRTLHETSHWAFILLITVA